MGDTARALTADRDSQSVRLLTPHSDIDEKIVGSALARFILTAHTHDVPDRTCQARRHTSPYLPIVRQARVLSRRNHGGWFMPADISVIIPAFRDAQATLQTLQSVLTQKDVSIEVLIMEGGPEARVEDVLRCLQDRRLRHLRQGGAPSRRRASDLRNMAWPQAQGSLIHFLDDGDIVPDGYYAQAKTAFAARPGLGIVLGQLQGFSAAGEDVSRETRALVHALASLAEHQASKLGLTSQLLFEPPPLVGGSALVRKSCLVAVGGYNWSLDSLEDLDLYTRIIRRFGAHFLDNVALRRRIDPGTHVPDSEPRTPGSCRALHDSYRREYGTLDYWILKLLAQRASAQRQKVLSSIRSSNRPLHLRLLIDGTVLHDKHHVGRGLNVSRRVPGHGDQIGEEAGLHAPQLAFLPNQLRVGGGGGGERLHGRHTIAHHPHELAVVAAVSKHPDIAAAADRYPEP